MLSFLQNFGKRKSSSQPILTRSGSPDSAMLSSTNDSISKADKDSTPATSTADTSSIAFETTPKPSERGEGSRALRPSRSNISSYNENVLSGSAKHGYRKKGVDSASRAVSGETLVDGKTDSPTGFLHRTTQGLNQGWSLGSLPGDNLPVKVEDEVKRRKSTRLSVFEFASSVVEQTKTVLGKRGRETNQTPAMKQDMGQSAVTLNAETPSFEGPVSKRLRLANEFGDSHSVSPPRATRKPSIRPVKRWLSQGLYVGQDPDFDPRLTTAKNKLKKANTKHDASQRRSVLPMPMFAGQRILETGRNYKLPFDVFSPLPPGQPKPDEWKKTHKNVFIGDAAAVWRKSRFEASRCVCTQESGCDHSCLNRHMFYECDDTNCNVGQDRCTNRSFDGLKQRHKKGGKYNIGVEVIKTADRGYGVRSNRTFEPHQIIVEYTGEIITQDECDDRMENRYKDNECFYLMEFDQKMILDATRGSIARFINHSCEPNCEMIKMTVAGKPRMALFAGENGIMTGEELTYDYNFNPYSVKNVQQCRCGAPTCRGILGPKPKEIKDALKPLTTGGKRKLQQAIEDGIQTVTKKRKINIPTGVRNALSNARAQTTGSLTTRTKVQAAKEDDKNEDSVKTSLRRIKSTSMLEKASSKTKTAMNTYSRRRSTATLAFKEEEVQEEEEDDNRPMSRRSSVKAAASSVRKNVVRTVKRGGRGAAGGRTGKSIRVIEDA
ncbi:MAG: hypothetical protein L6R42_001673 [Xanthoria sp. 1 TBL-2021]|nr:MAG: hypothetical protein L6R42_001673 [Xanthoria sp. 1 TBL-2021]